MCGIVGYIGNKQAQRILFSCLSKLEYRGYDSCGIAVAAGNIQVHKDAVRVEELAKVAPQLGGTAGIGHTRWATHGEPSQINAHPHLDCTGNIAVVHNGIINNFQKLRQQLTAEGHNFVSETDTEVIPHLIEKYYEDNLEKAVEAAMHDVEGSYAIIVLIAGKPELIAARKDSPLIIGVSDRENLIASDVPAILDYTSRVIYLEDGDIGVISKDSIRVRRNGIEVDRTQHKILWNVEDAQKAGYEHFMLKEIHEQPKVIRDTLSEYTQVAEPVADLVRMRDAGIESMIILACGTSYHAALIGKYLTEELVGIPVRAELATEFNYYGQTLARTMAIVITQSGETADTLKAIRKLKEVGCRVLAITNVVGSTASRIADQTIHTRAGPEISVAATKSFIAHNKDKILEYAKYLSRYENVFFIGRGINYPVALEGALKLKEISYIHAEGYAAGELKHGPFALLGSDTPVIAIVAQDNTYEPMLTNIKEVKARGSPLIAVAVEGNEAIEELADSVITVPPVDAIFSPVVNIVVLQLLAYYTAKERGCPIDFPRNLAKSVTVE